MGAKAAEPSLLVGLAYDEAGERMTPTHANKKGRRYRYYVSHSLIGEGRQNNGDAGLRMPAGELESLVETRIIAFLGDPVALYETLETVESEAGRRQAMIREAAQLAERWSTLSSSDRRAILLRLIERIVIRRECIEITVRPGVLPVLLGPGADPTRPSVEADRAETMVMSVPVQLRRAGKEMRLLIEGPVHHPQTSPDRSLLRLLGQARRFQAMVMRGSGASITALAEDAGVGPSYFTRVLKLSFLSPALVEAIVEGRHPARLNAKSLTRDASQLASAWSAQAVQLRFI